MAARVIPSYGCVVLAGGHGSRLGGVNKALLDIGGLRTIDRVLHAVRPHASDVRLIVNNNALATLGLPLHLDPEPHAGVLPALLAGLTASTAEYCLVTACDMPFIQSAIVQQLFLACQDHDVAMPRVDGRPEPMLAVYRRAACVTAIRASLDRGQMRMIAFLDGIDVVWLDEDTLRGSDPDLRSFFNINEPEDLARAQVLAIQGD